MSKIQFDLGFKLDKTGIAQAKQELTNLGKEIDKKFANKELKIDKASYQEVKKEIDVIGKAMDKAFSADLNKLNLKTFSKELNKAGVDIQSASRRFGEMGEEGVQAFLNIQRSMMNTGVQIKKTNGLVQEMADTLSKTVKWSVASSAVNAFQGAVGKAVGFVKNLDDSLNQIRIVTGKSSKEMAVFAEQANESAKALGKTTREYTDASLLFFQQGKSAAEVKELTQATLMAANITGTEVKDMADMITSALNGYSWSADKAIQVTDTLAAVGAATGADFQELAVGMSKVASQAATVGVPFEKLNAMLATISETTREAPETIGTSLKTVFARMSEIKLTGSATDEDGVTMSLGKVQDALSLIDVSVTDSSGAMRDMGTVIEEIGGKWEGLDVATKSAITNAMAGQRQASRLMALFNQWERYEVALDSAQNATGATMEQNIIRTDSLAYKSKQLTNELEEMYMKILSPDLMKGMTEGLTEVVSVVNDLIDGLGGIQNILFLVGGAAVQVFSKQMAGGLTKAYDKAVELTGQIGKTLNKTQEFISTKVFNKPSKASSEPDTASQIESSGADIARAAGTAEQVKYNEAMAKARQQELAIAQNLSEEDLKSFQRNKEALLLEHQKLIALKKQREEKEAAAETSLLSRGSYSKQDVLENPAAAQEEVAKAVERATESVKKQKTILSDIETIRKEEFTTAQMLEIATTSDIDKLGKKQRMLRRLIDDGKINLNGLLEGVSVQQTLEETEGEINEKLKERQGYLKDAIQDQRDILDIVETQNESYEEEKSREEIDRLDTQNQLLEEQAKKQQVVQAGISAIGTAMQLIGALSTFKQLGDDTLSAGEKLNVLKSGFMAVAGVLLGAIPVVASLSAAFTTMGMTAAAAWMRALLPVLPVIAAVAALGAGIAWLVKEFNPLNRAIEKNAEVLEKQNAALEESKNRVKDLRGATSALEELKEIQLAGIDEGDTEAMARYVDLSNQVASVAPELVRYYDEEGNAIIDLNANLDSLIDSELELQKVAQEAKEANRDNFITEYKNIVDTETERIESKRAILEEIKKKGSYTDAFSGVTYDSSDITSLTSEITDAQQKIKETQGLIQQNIVDPIYGASEAYQGLDKANQTFARGLIDTGRLSDKLGDPEKVERYTGLVNRYMDGMAEKAKPVQAELDAVNVKLEELRNSEAPDANAIATLKQQAEDLKGKLADARGPLEELTDTQTQNALEMASMFDIADGKLDSFMTKVVESTISTQSLVGALSTGTMPNAADLMGEAGMETSAGMNDEVAQSQAATQAAREKAAAYMELSKAHQEYDLAMEYGLPIEQEVIDKALEYKEVSDEVGEARNAVTDAVIEENNLKLEQLTLQREEEELQAQLEEQYWANVDALMETTEGYNQLADAYNQSVEAAGNMDQVQESLKDAFAAGDVEAVSGALEQYRDKIPGLADALDDMAKNGVGSMGEVETAIQKVADMQGKMYAKMKGTDTAYWNDFKKRNAGQTKVIEMEYGIRADDYANYQEYEKALNQAAEKGKRFNMDETTRNMLLNMSEEEIAAWEKENGVLSYNDEANRQMVANDAESKKSQILSYGSLKDAGFTTFQALAISAASVADAVANFFGGIVNTVAGVVNGVIEGIEGLVNKAIGGVNKILATAGKLPGVPTVQLPEVSFGRFNGVGTSNMAGALMDRWTPTDTGGPDLPSFDYGGSGNIDKKPGTDSTDSNQDNSSGPDLNEKPDKGSGGSGGGGDKGGSEEEVEDLEWEEDIYHDINIQLEQKQQLLDKLQKQQDKLYGRELLDNLAKQKKVLQEQQALLEKKLEMQRQDLAQQKQQLSSSGVQFNEDGTIANYNTLLAQKLAYVNSLSGEAKEAAKEEFEALVGMMEAYEEMMMNTITDTEEAIQDSIDAQREIWLQEFEYAIQLKIEISDDFKEALDYMKDMNTEFEDYSDNYERTTAQIEEQLDLIARLKTKLEEINNNPDLTEAERLDLLQKYNEELKNAVKDLSNLENSLTKLFKDTLKDGLEMVQDHMDEFKHLNDQLKHYEQTLKLIGEGDNYEVLDSIYEAQYNNLMGQIDVMNAQMSTLEAEKAAMEAAGLTGTEEWKAVDEAIKKTQSSINSLAQESLKLLQQEFKNSVNEIMSSLEDQMTGGMGFKEMKKQHQELKEERKKYLDGEEKLLSISKLQQKVQKEIDETSDPAKKAELQKFMDTELVKLKEKDKLTKYDVDRANLIYDITLKQMALDEQRATKNIMRLVRDTQGNWVYEFTEDAKAIEKAQEDVSSSMEKLMELDKKKLEETQDLMMKLQEEYYKEVEQITKDAANGKYKTEEELREALQKVNDKYNEKMVEANAEYEEVKLNATISSMSVILDTYKRTGTGLEGMTEDQQKLLKALADNTGDSFLDMSQTIGALLTGKGVDGNPSVKAILDKLGKDTGLTAGEMGTALNGMATDMQSKWGTAVTDMLSKFIGDDGEGGFKKAATGTVDAIIGKWNEYQTKLNNVQTQTGTDLGSIKDGIEKVDKATEELTTETDELIKKFGDELSAVTSLTIAYQKNREEIRKTIKDMLDYIDTINKAIEAIKRKNDTESNNSGGNSGGGSGSGGSSGSGGGSSTPPPPPPNKTPSFTKGEKVRVKKDSTYYQVSNLTGPYGTATVNTPYLLDDPATYRPMSGYSGNTHISNSNGGDLGWLPKSALEKFDTGGYTGAWGNEGKVAMLHEKEIVLNKHDTSNILKAISMLRDSSLANIARKFTPSSNNYSTNSYDNSSTSQNVTIHADFSGVTSSNEIEKAFENMANMASQYANR